MRYILALSVSLLLLGCDGKVVGGLKDVSTPTTLGPKSVKPEPVPAKIAGSLRITTMNIEWFGRGGSKNGTETRIKSLSEFFDKNYNDVDVFMFQEIAVPSMLAQVLPDYNCLTYEHRSRNHQHVVACAKKPLKLTLSHLDNNYKIESVAIGSNGLRPAMHAIVKNEKNQALVYIAGVHLAAFERGGPKRWRQINALANYLKGVKKLPVVLLGDFNPFQVDNKHESFSYTKTFSKAGLNFTHKTKHLPITFSKRNLRKSFDHIWVNDKFRKTSEVHVFEICAGSSTQYKNIFEYNELVSDHCPVTIDVK